MTSSFYHLTFFTNDIALFKKKALQWVSSFDVCCYLDSNSFADKYSKFDSLIAAGVKHQLSATIGDAFEQLAGFKKAHQNEWLTGSLTYELKDELEDLSSKGPDKLHFPGLYFFVPEFMVVINGNSIDIQCTEPERIFTEINNTDLKISNLGDHIDIKARLTKQRYIETINRIKEHIGRGDIYVTNFCQEFYADDAIIDPLYVFSSLNEVSPNPFACFFKYHRQYIICASPERFLAKRGNKVISQPIKGTAPRGINKAEDKLIKQKLGANTKEQQENVMVVDMVRNDLTRCAEPGTVTVEELFGLYSFNHIHQMISTVTCEVGDHISEIDVIKSAFPMGSMTGAPKLSAMQLMEEYEVSKRGAYSGAVGYFSPDGDFDFNVVIRSILYNAESRYLSFHAGSAITFDADAEAEYEECLLKTKAIRQVLAQ